MYVFIIFFFLLTGSLSAFPPDTNTIPPELEKWKSWVLHGMEKKFCPTPYNDGNVYHCLWPSRLKLNLDENKGCFTQEWTVFRRAWIPLPGSSDFWPFHVKVDGRDAPVIGKEGVPSVFITHGKHRIEGIFNWNEMPEMIHVPPRSGLITLIINGTKVKFPIIDSDGRLWLKKKEDSGLHKEQRVDLRIFRLINDTIPMEVMNLLKIDISGRAKEIKFNDVLLENSIPMMLKSPLPARLGPEGELMIHGRPGRWEIRILTRFQSPVQKIKAVKVADKQEIWAFQPQNHLRIVKIEGVSSVDPKQTDIPAHWQKFPAFIIQSGSEMIFKEIRRGNPDPAPDRLNLKRTWWLDFNGSGFTVQDEIEGTMSQNWYLAMNPPFVLGRVSVDGIDQLITGQGKDRKQGVELRKGQIRLVAESMCGNLKGSIPTVGWDHDFQTVSGILNLPPGWRLFTAKGVDEISGTWFLQWTLWDFFLVLIISLAVFKLWNWHWGLLALVTLSLIYHEPGAPRFVWLNLLGSLALLRFLPGGWVKNVVNFWRWGSVIILLVISVPFMVQQVQWGMYPQLEPHRAGPEFPDFERNLIKKTTEAKEKQVIKDKAINYKKESPGSILSQTMSREAGYYQKNFLQQSPDALIQTGPGLPSWRWRKIVLNWNGPVVRDQQIRLWLLSPFVGFILAFLRVGLLAFLIVFIIDFRSWKTSGKKEIGLFLLLLLLITPSAGFSKNSSIAYPSDKLLDQLQKRLLEKSDCFPHCADNPLMHLTAEADHIEISVTLNAATKTAVPLPGSLKSWTPEQILMDGKPAPTLFRDEDGLLWALIPEGIHKVTLTGSPPLENSFQILLPMSPRHVTVKSSVWGVQGVGKDGRVKASIQLTKLTKNATDRAVKDVVIKPFFHIERILSLGLNWEVRTKVTRITPTGESVIISVPLIGGESVTTDGIKVEGRHAILNMGPKKSEIKWTSTLKKSSRIQLKSPESILWAETWILNVSPIWHCNLSGIPVVYHQDREGYWNPQWKPLPGEIVNIEISRPEAIPGRVLTIDKTKLVFIPGQRFARTSLAVNIRSSKGGQHQITLPDGADLIKVNINGKSQPIRQKGKDVIIPLKPGSQIIDMQWHQSNTSSIITRSPPVKIGQESVNSEISFHMPQNRWILFAGGPRLGPAVLFWSYVWVIILAAAGLGRITWTPVKTSHWFLLGLGLTQVKVIMAILIVGWLLALGLRKKNPLKDRVLYFNLTQLILIFWTLVALFCLYLSVQAGLLGIPDMQISGNGSSSFLLNWTQDRIGSFMPRPWVFSLPLIVFRLLMLFWALWLAVYLLKWLRWGWNCFSEGGWWRKSPSIITGQSLSKENGTEEG